MSNLCPKLVNLHTDSIYLLHIRFNASRQLVRDPAVPAYLATCGRRVDPDPPELGHRRHEIAEEGILVGRAVVDCAT